MFFPNDVVSDYTLIKWLGDGTFGDVWLAEKEGKQFALKFPKAKVKLHEIQKEVVVWLLAKGHRNVLPVEGIDLHDDRVFIISEFAPEGSLEEWLCTHGGKAPSIDKAIEMMLGILDGLAYLHKRKIIHRDIKPANILLSKDAPRIADFGLAKFILSETESQLLKGTPVYMSPEAWQGKRNEQTDLWSACVVFYEMLCGDRPFLGRGQPEVMYSICNLEPQPLSDEIPGLLRDFVIRGLKKKVEERYATLNEMRHALQMAYQEVIQLAKQPTIITPEPVIVMPDAEIVIEELEKRRQQDSFVLINAGEFMMGGEQYDDEKPVHKVRISKAFEMGKYQVTQAQWELAMRNNPSHFKGVNLPVEQVSWNEVQKFIKKLNAEKDGYVYRLPTEAEWEYACRAGTTGDYAGNLDEMGWSYDNSEAKIHSVGEKKANAWGLYDMHGNVWEWCADWYDEGYYKKSPEVDPKGPDSGSGRVLRGGSWNYRAAACRSAHRSNGAPGTRFNHLGFRLVRTNT
jgi:formylglycine-generating enzyme required for sulfatase activity